MPLDGCRWLSRSGSLPRPGHGLILIELIKRRRCVSSEPGAMGRAGGRGPSVSALELGREAWRISEWDRAVGAEPTPSRGRGEGRPRRANRLRHTAARDVQSVRRQRAVETQLGELNTVWSLIDLPCTVGRPSVSMVETDGSFVALQNPQRSVRKAQGA